MMYTVYAPDKQNPLSGDNISKIEFIAERKSIWALLLPYLWLIYHKLWWELLAFAIYMIAPIFVAQQGAEVHAVILSYLPAVFLFLEGSALRCYRLERKGWHYLGVVEAENSSDAEFKFFKQYEFKSAIHTPTPSANESLALGLESNHKPISPRIKPTFGLFE